MALLNLTEGVEVLATDALKYLAAVTVRLAVARELCNHMPGMSREFKLPMWNGTVTDAGGVDPTVGIKLIKAALVLPDYSVDVSTTVDFDARTIMYHVAVHPTSGCDRTIVTAP